MQQHIKSLEDDRNYWKEEAELHLRDSGNEKDRRSSKNNDLDSVGKRERENEKRTGRLSHSSEEMNGEVVNNSKEIDHLKRELKHYRNQLMDITGQNNELKQLLDERERNLSPPVKDKVRCVLIGSLDYHDKGSCSAQRCRVEEGSHGAGLVARSFG